MDIGRFSAYFEHFIGSGSTKQVTKDALAKVCGMYTGETEGSSRLEEACEGFLNTIQGPSTADKVLDVISRGGSTFGETLEKIKRENDTNKPQSSLKTFMETNLQDDDDDSSVDEVSFSLLAFFKGG